MRAKAAGGMMNTKYGVQSRTRSQTSCTRKRTICSSIHQDDWRTYRARLVAGNSFANQSINSPNFRVLLNENKLLAEEPFWAHPIGTIERGCLLISTSTAPHLLNNEFAWQLVIFLAHYDPQQGAVGYTLNRPSSLKMGRLPGISPDSELKNRVFEQNRIYCGGLHQQEIISVIHGIESIEKSQEIIPGIYVGGHEAASAAILDGKCKSSSFKFFSGFYEWEAGQVEQEIEQGVWHVAASCRSLVLKGCLSLPEPLWCETMNLMGGEYAKEARSYYIEDELDSS